PNLRVHVDTQELLPRDHPFVRSNSLIEKIFGGSELVMVALVTPDGAPYSPQLLAAVARVTKQFARLPGVHNVLSLSADQAKYVESTPDGIVVEAMIAPGDAVSADILQDRLRHSPLLPGTVVSSDGRAAAVAFEADYSPAIPDAETLQR